VKDKTLGAYLDFKTKGTGKLVMMCVWIKWSFKDFAFSADSFLGNHEFDLEKVLIKLNQSKL
jgi:hypothetical protein